MGLVARGSERGSGPSLFGRHKLRHMTAQKYVNGFVQNDRITLLRRNEEGVLVSRSMPATYASFHPLVDFTQELLRELRDNPRVVGLAVEGDHVRLRWRERWDRKNCVKILAELGSNDKAQKTPVRNYEADVDPIRRLFSDVGLEVQAPVRSFFDLEVDSRKTFAQMVAGDARVLSWAAWDQKWAKRSAVLADDSDEAERALLMAFFEEMKAYDQLLAWNGEGFDFLVLQERAKKLGILGPRVDLRRWLWLDQMKLFERMNKNASESGDEKQSLSLENVGFALLGHGKSDFDGSRTWEAWEAGGAHRQELVDYNENDAKLMVEIEVKTGYVELFQTICEVCRCFPTTRTLLPSLQVDGMMLRLGVKKGFKFASRDYEEDGEYEQFEGAMVMKDVPKGIQREVHVADFASMYPSIIVTWNMSPETLVTVPAEGPIPQGSCRAPSTRQGFSTTTLGILTYAVSETLRMRKHWSALQATLVPGTPEWVDAGRRSMAYKVFANTFFGVISSRFSRYYSRAIGESITQNGVWLIKQVKAECEVRGWRVVYADTDSVFVIGPTRKEFADFCAWLNVDFFPRVVAETGAMTNLVKIAYEKQFSRLCFVMAKKYVGSYAHYKGKDADATSKPEIKGLEWKRGDWNRLARGFQHDVLMAFHKGELEAPTYEAIVAKHRVAILDGPLAVDDIVVSKSVQKSVFTDEELLAHAAKKLGKKPEEVTQADLAATAPESGYVTKLKKDGNLGAVQPHVAVAKILKARGREMRPGLRIDYVIVDGTKKGGEGVVPLEDYKGECDRFHLWEKLVYPATQRVLEAMFPEQDWKRHLRARPLKPRGKKGALSLLGQAALALPAPVAAPRNVPREPVGAIVVAPRGFRKKQAPLVITISGSNGSGTTLTDLAVALRDNPGGREVRLVVRVDGGEAVLDLPQRVSTTPGLLARVRALGGITSSEATIDEDAKRSIGGATQAGAAG